MPIDVPDYQTLMRPVLQIAALGDATVPEAVKQIAKQFNLTEEQLALLLPSRQQTLIANRTHWARTYLDKAGLLTTVRRGVFRATDRGKQVLAANPTRIDNKVLATFPEFLAFMGKRNSPSNSTTTLPTNAKSDDLVPAPTPPEERIDKAVQELDTALADELLDRIFTITPMFARALFFERLVLRLLVSMGYGLGLADASTHLGGKGDGGVDGVVHLDALGLDRVYIQAKCYDRQTSIQPSQVRDFSGSLDDKKTSRGVFITTASFSKAAIDYVAGIQKQIVLIYGEELARLMINHGVGVRTERTVVIKKLDEDAFED